MGTITKKLKVKHEKTSGVQDTIQKTDSMMKEKVKSYKFLKNVSLRLCEIAEKETKSKI